MLIFQIKIIVSSEKWFNYAVTFFGGEMPKISAGRTTLSLLHSRLVGRSVAGRLDDAKRRKKRMA